VEEIKKRLPIWKKEIYSGFPLTPSLSPMGRGSKGEGKKGANEPT
jgi:hypothetical protein